MRHLTTQYSIHNVTKRYKKSTAVAFPLSNILQIEELLLEMPYYVAKKD
jgi:hypothetical protein